MKYKRKIDTFQQRHKAQYIYDTYFDTYSEHLLDFSIFDTLHFYGVISKKEFNKLSEKFEKIGDNLWDEMEKFDKEQLKN